MNYEEPIVSISPALTPSRYCSSSSDDIVQRVKDVSFNLTVDSTKTHHRQSISNNSISTRTDKRHSEGRNERGQRSRSRHCQSGTRSTRQLRRNERERGRKARLNAAFQVLKSVVPDNIANSGSSDRKMTQVEILRLAKNYISNLTELLRQDTNISFTAFKTE